MIKVYIISGWLNVAEYNKITHEVITDGCSNFEIINKETGNQVFYGNLTYLAIKIVN